ncbi:MAG: pitrilysin family protein [Planctomycetota bacterium]|nr:pitrilysin family protein [Planctomycetota bacterium]
MQQQSIHTHQFENGLMLIVEEMRGLQSAAFSFLVPAGSIYDGSGKNGVAAMLADWITRGAGPHDSRELTATLDNLGISHSESAGSANVTFTAASVADRITDGLAIFGDIIRRPHLEEDQFEPVKLGAEQSLIATEDDPQRKAMVELRRRSFSAPWGLSSDGSLEDLPSISADDVRSHHDRCFHPNGAILGVAGNVDAQEVIDAVAANFGDWEKKPNTVVEPGDRGEKRSFIEHESAQTHIGISYDSVSFPDPDYYAAWAAVSVLSGGMSARLFTEVREKRGLCYSVYASQSSLKHEGQVLCYAGTSNERAQETLDVTLQELKRLGDGIDESELQRCKARAKSSLVMQQESSRGRAGSLARNWFFLEQIRTLDDVRQKIDALTIESILDYVHRRPAQDFTVLTIGPEQLTVNE